MSYIRASTVGVIGGIIGGTLAGVVYNWLNPPAKRDFKNHNVVSNGDKCSILIFLEDHGDQGSTKAILDILDDLVNRGYKDYLFEEPSDVTYQATYNAIHQAMNHKLNGKVSDLHSQIKARGIDVDRKQVQALLENPDLAPEPLKAVSINYNDLKKSYLYTLKLLKSINNNELNIHNIDMPTKMREYFNSKYSPLDKEYTTLRDSHMSTEAEDICLAGGSKQVLLVGGSHHSIGKILKNKGFDVKLFAVFAGRPSQKSDFDPRKSQAEIDDLIASTYLRNDYKSGSLPKELADLLLIDLYDNPELQSNYAAILLDTLDREENVLHGINNTVPVDEPQ
jgi:hypothetical protein